MNRSRENWVTVSKSNIMTEQEGELLIEKNGL